MRVLGAILAGGQARRFGSDKALALLEGRALIDHVAAALGPQVEALVVCGREHQGLTSVPDRPAAGLGPLGGLAGALHHAREHGYDALVSAPCDTPLLPLDLVMALRGAEAAFVAGQPVIGWWPAALAPVLDHHLATQPGRSMRGWIAARSARAVQLPPLINVNRPDDLAAFQ